MLKPPLCLQSLAALEVALLPWPPGHGTCATSGPGCTLVLSCPCDLWSFLSCPSLLPLQDCFLYHGRHLYLPNLPSFRIHILLWDLQLSSCFKTEAWSLCSPLLLPKASSDEKRDSKMDQECDRMPYSLPLGHPAGISGILSWRGGLCCCQSPGQKEPLSFPVQGGCGEE